MWWLSRYPKNSLGFTLVEILVALFVFAILGTLSIIGMRSLMHVYQRTQRVNKELKQLQMATAVMRSDIGQLIQRPILNERGVELPPLMVTSTHRLEFTTAGYSNPVSLEKRSTLRRVAYDWQNGKLIRLTWPALDRPPHSVPERRVLLRHVTQMTLMYVNQRDQFMNVWATSSGFPDALIQLPRAIVVTLTLSHLGVWQGVFPIVGRGYGE